jgi:predicted AAA+ superfamily ATPase
MINHIRHLLAAGVKAREILFVNFEDPRFNGELNNDFLEQIFNVYLEFVNHETKPHIFLDEVQYVTQWEKWVLTGYELNRAHFYITGSSSKLLSKEFGTALGGRYLDITVFPLSFDEFLLFRGIDKPDKKTLVTQKIPYKKVFNDYIRTGGFPKINSLDDDLKKPEIIMYYETIILKDIVARYNLKNYDNVKKVALYLLSNIGKPLNLNKVRTSIQLSYDLVDKYFEYLKETFLLTEINQFDYSLMRQFANRRKIYCIDNGILSFTSFRISEDYGRYLENMVFIELMRRGYEVYFYNGQKECDFLIKQGLSVTGAIQVCTSLLDKDTKNREMEGLSEAINAFGLNKGIILTDDEEDTFQTDNIKIEVKPVWKWILER